MPPSRPGGIFAPVLSFARGVGHEARVATAFKLTVALLPSGRRPVALAPLAICEPVAFPTVGVGHEPEPLPDVRCPDAVCAQYRRPAGVTLSLQISENSVEPTKPDGAFNLLAKDADRSDGSNEPEPLGPEVSLVCGAALLAGGAERLAGAGAGPQGLVVSKSSQLSCV
jgi:hypothetical protein